jgi:hypothetical protein
MFQNLASVMSLSSFLFQYLGMHQRSPAQTLPVAATRMQIVRKTKLLVASSVGNVI